MLKQALLPGVRTAPQAARVVAPLPTYLTSYGTAASPAPSAGMQTRLTALNDAMLGFQPNPGPNAELDPEEACECKPKRKKDGEKKCVNPVVSRQRRGDLSITTRRIKCPPSKPKLA